MWRFPKLQKALQMPSYTFCLQHLLDGYLKFGNICWLKLIKRRVEKFYFVNYMRKAKMFAAEVCVVEQVQRQW